VPHGFQSHFGHLDEADEAVLFLSARVRAEHEAPVVG
jgi:epsilon-lactone hydrolase